MDCWLNPADSSIIRCIHSIHCELHALFSLYALDNTCIYTHQRSLQFTTMHAINIIKWVKIFMHSWSNVYIYRAIAPLCRNPGMHGLCNCIIIASTIVHVAYPRLTHAIMYLLSQSTYSTTDCGTVYVACPWITNSVQHVYMCTVYMYTSYLYSTIVSVAYRNWRGKLALVTGTKKNHIRTRTV